MVATLFLAGCLLSVLVIYRYILHPLLLSPLAAIPSAHWSAPLSSLWILSVRNHHRENRTLHAAHRRLGPVVRVGPNTLSVDGVDGLKTIYQGGFEKDPWYTTFASYGQANMFSTVSSREHAARKRTVSHVYSKSFIQGSPAAAAQARAILFGRLLPVIAHSTSPSQTPQGIDVFSMFLATMMDFISAYVYGLHSGADFLRNKPFRDHWLELYLARTGHHFWPQELPGLTRVMKSLGVNLCPAWVDDANQELGDWNLQMCKKAAEAEEKKAEEDVEVEDEAVVFRAIHSGLDKEEKVHATESILYLTSIQNRELYVASELFDHVTAGQETAGIALTYLSWHLSQNLELQHELRAEVLTLSPPLKLDRTLPASLPDPKQLDALPVLHAVIMETLRLHAPIPGPQPRQTPYPYCRIGPYTVPGGVRVASLAYTLHTNERVFPDPSTWNHRRWLPSESTEEERRERNRYFWAFGSGGRMCVGSNFAMHGMKHIAAAVYTNFTSYIVDDEGMEPSDSYTSRPTGDRLYLRFRPQS